VDKTLVLPDGYTVSENTSQKRGDPMAEVQTENIMTLLTEAGFECLGEFDPADLEARVEVREMCAADKCHAYGHSWACPPALADLDTSNERFHHYQHGLVFQTIGNMEDEFDYEAIIIAEKEHHRRFNKLVDELADDREQLMLLAAGTCTICPTCTYPDKPCRFPDKVYPSMEAMGLMVADVCKLAGIPYYHGPGTLAFCSSLLY
jgi:predicted metal-binding protein